MSYNDYVAKLEPKAASGELNKKPYFKPPPFDLKARLSENRPIAVFFEQTQCPNCDVLHNRSLVNKETENIINAFTVIQLDMWSDQKLVTPQGKATTAKEWAKSLNVKYAPSIVLFDTSGKEVIRSEAFFKKFHTQGIFAYVLEGAYRKEPSFQRYLSQRAEHMIEQGKNVNIWE